MSPSSAKIRTTRADDVDTICERFGLPTIIHSAARNWYRNPDIPATTMEPSHLQLVLGQTALWVLGVFIFASLQLIFSSTVLSLHNFWHNVLSGMITTCGNIGEFPFVTFTCARTTKFQIYTFTLDYDYTEILQSCHNATYEWYRSYSLGMRKFTVLFRFRSISAKDFFTHFSRYSIFVIILIIYWKRCSRYETKHAIAFFEIQHLWEHTLEPGAHPPVDLLPFLKYIPERWAHWKGLCADVRKRQRDLYFGLLTEARKE